MRSSVRPLELEHPHGIELTYAIAAVPPDAQQQSAKDSALSSQAVYNGEASAEDLPYPACCGSRLDGFSAGVCRTRLILRAESAVERMRWIQGLQARQRAPASGACFSSSSSSSYSSYSSSYSEDAASAAVPSASAQAVEAATLSAKRAAARAESGAVASDICIAMGASDRRDDRCSVRGSADDVDAFLMQRQQDVWAELAAGGFQRESGGYARPRARPLAAGEEAAARMKSVSGSGEGPSCAADVLLAEVDAEQETEQEAAEEGFVDVSERDPPVAAAEAEVARTAADGMQMLIALGATPLVVEGSAGSAKAASQLATYAAPVAGNAKAVASSLVQGQSHKAWA